jgi:6-phosphogluconolactonase
VAAGEIARRAAAAVGARGRFDVALAGGTTPRRTYQLLAEAPRREAVPWAGVHVFFGDERSVPPHHLESNYRMAREALLDRVPIPPGQVHRIHAEATDAEAAARDYEAEMRQALGLGPLAVPRLDLVLLGMGADGHVASLFPGSDALSEERLLALAVLSPKPPPRRITLTLLALNAAAAVVVLVAGLEKAERLAEVLQGRGDPGLPARRLRPAGELLWLADAEAASRLR